MGHGGAGEGVGGPGSPPVQEGVALQGLLRDHLRKRHEPAELRAKPDNRKAASSGLKVHNFIKIPSKFSKIIFSQMCASNVAF